MQKHTCIYVWINTYLQSEYVSTATAACIHLHRTHIIYKHMCMHAYIHTCSVSIHREHLLLCIRRNCKYIHTYVHAYIHTCKASIHRQPLLQWILRKCSGIACIKSLSYMRAYMHVFIHTSEHTFICIEALSVALLTSNFYQPYAHAYSHAYTKTHTYKNRHSFMRHDEGI